MSTCLRVAMSLAVLGCGGCGSTVKRAIRSDWIGTPKARLTTYMQCFDHEENTPGGIRHDAIRDEATLATLSDGEACIDVVVRTDAAVDEPLDQLEPLCSGTAGTVTDETVSVLDYAYIGSVEKVAVQGVAASAFLGLSITEPGEKAFRVIERKARVCCAASAGKQINLKLVSKRMMYNSVSYGEDFVWQLQ